MIAIIDYGMGNLRSVEKGLEKVGFPAVVTSDPEVVRHAPGVILPGVGAFADAMENLTQAGMIEVIREVVDREIPFLGICLGYQLMFTVSEENGNFPGLNLFPGEVRRIPAGVKIPHMGWNQIAIRKDCPLFRGIPDGTDFYFVHSYAVHPADPGIVAAVTDYNGEFASVVAAGRTFGAQFHPEKSSHWGLTLLKNFGELVNS